MPAPRAITPAELHGIDTYLWPVRVVGSRGGYAVAVGTDDNPRWLHTPRGQFHLFQRLDRAAALLQACGIHRFSIDLTGGTPQ